MLVYGLVELRPLDVVTGLVIVQCAKAWCLDRMTLLFDDMKFHLVSTAAPHFLHTDRFG